jgi:hypothetical protein
MSELTKEKEKNQRKMTLKGYYLQIPDASHPKTDFVNEIAIEAGVSVATVRNWVVYGMKPQNKKHIEILVRKTGIPAEDLWED